MKFFFCGLWLVVVDARELEKCSVIFRCEILINAKKQGEMNHSMLNRVVLRTLLFMIKTR